MSSESPFMLAGLTTSGQLDDGSEFTCYSVITGPAAPHLEAIHDRMPVVLPPDFFDDWLDPDTAGSSALIEAAVAARDSIAADVTAGLADAKSGTATPLFK